MERFEIIIKRDREIGAMKEIVEAALDWDVKQGAADNWQTIEDLTAALETYRSTQRSET